MKIHYAVEITGHAAPFKWQLVRQEAGKTIKLGDAGECDTYEECLWAAQDAAQPREYARLHAATKRTEVLFEVEEESPPDPPAPAQPDAWPAFDGA